jgi:peroxiredoxin
MTQIALHTPSPDFQIPDLNGNIIQLSQYAGKSNILLVFNRGFT